MLAIILIQTTTNEMSITSAAIPLFVSSSGTSLPPRIQCIFTDTTSLFCTQVLVIGTVQLSTRKTLSVVTLNSSSTIRRPVLGRSVKVGTSAFRLIWIIQVSGHSTA